MLTEPQIAFMKLAIEMAKKINDDNGLLISGQVSQACWESGWGKRSLGNNCFGIKGHTSHNHVNCPYVAGEQEFVSHESDPNKALLEKFAKYNNLEDCFACHALLLKQNFPSAFGAKTIEEYAQALVHDPISGKRYALDQRYYDNLLSLTNRHNLRDCDVPPKITEKEGDQNV